MMDWWPAWITGVVVLVLALLFDLLLGELPSSLHPVVWFGKIIGLLEQVSPKNGRQAQLVFGGAAVGITVCLVAGVVWWLLEYLRAVAIVAHIIIGAYLLKSSFALRELMAAAGRVRQALEANDLDGSRYALRSLVSRDTSRLSRPLLAAAAVESVAENSSDSVIAPLLYFAVFGVPGAVAYRLINTFDSMIGYHGKYEYLGKIPARLDDAANWLPARFTALLLVLGARLTGFDGRRAWRIMERHHDRTESPNAGWPMSAMAGALGVALEKVRHYRLGEARTAVTPATIGYAMRIGWMACALGLVLLSLLRLVVSVRFP